MELQQIGRGGCFVSVIVACALGCDVQKDNSSAFKSSNDTSNHFTAKPKEPYISQQPTIEPKQRPLIVLEGTPGLEDAIARDGKLPPFATYAFFAENKLDQSRVVCHTSEGSGRAICRFIVLDRIGQDSWKVVFQSATKDYTNTPASLWIVTDAGKTWLEERRWINRETQERVKVLAWR